MYRARRHFLSTWTPAEIMLAVLFLLAPLYYHPNLGGGGLRIPDNSTIWLTALIFIAYTLNKVIHSADFQLPRYFIFVAAFPVLAILSGFLAGVEQPLEWLFRVLFILGGLAFFFCLFQARLKQGRWDRLLLIIVAAGLVHAGIGVLQVWLKGDMPYLLPKSPEGIPAGFFQQINNQASFLVTSIVLSFYLASRPVLFKRARLVQQLTVLSVLLASYIVGEAGSRIGLLSLLVALPIVLIARRFFLLKNKAFTVLLLLGLLGGLSLGLASSGARTIDKTVAIQSGYSGSARLGIYDISLALFKEKPLFGHGIGSFPRVFQQARPDFYAAYPAARLPTQMVSHPHNELLIWLVEGGIIAVAGILLVVIGVILALFRLGGRRAWSYLALLLPIGLHMQVELPLYMSALHWFVLLTLMALPFHHCVSRRRNGMTVSALRLSSFALLAVTVLGSLFLMHTIRANWDFVAFYQGKQKENPLSVAKKNLYLSEPAQWIAMSVMMYSSMQYGLDENVEYYVEWGEQQLRKNPDVDLYIKLTDAYEYLGNKARYCTVARQGLAVYPESERLKRANHSCQY